jgi:hypothetical protein
VVIFLSAAEPEYDKTMTTSEREHDICHQKLTWATRDEALAAAAYARWQYGDGSSRPRPYQCRMCGKWHLARHIDDEV